MLYKSWLLLFILFLGIQSSRANYLDTTITSSPSDAVVYLNSIKKLKPSKYWPNIDPEKLLENLKIFTTHPLQFYEGRTTNFCAYSVLTYIPLKHDPVGFARTILSLYNTGKSVVGRVTLIPSKAVRKEAGLIKYKGELDVNPVGQMWFLTLADYFKGYINLLNRKYNAGDENTLWASTNYAKFNRMLTTLFKGKIESKGSDIIRPRINDIEDYIAAQMQKGIVFLYVNNNQLYRHNHANPFIKTATHYVMVTDIKKTEDGDVEFVYRDYGMKTLQKLSPEFLKNIVYGITTFTFKK